MKSTFLILFFLSYSPLIITPHSLTISQFLVILAYMQSSTGLCRRLSLCSWYWYKLQCWLFESCVVEYPASPTGGSIYSGYIPFCSDETFFNNSFPLGRFCDQFPYISKTRSQMLCESFLTLEKIPAWWVEPSPVEMKIYKANALPSELAGPRLFLFINLQK